MAGQHTLQYPLDLTTNTQYSHRITFQAYHQGTVNTQGVMIALYMPGDALKTSYSQSYGDVNMGAMGTMITGGGGDELIKTMQTATGGDLTGALKSIAASVGAVTGRAAVGGQAAAIRESLGKIPVGGVGAAEALEKKMGFVLNPHKAVVYQGPGGFRTFSYSFTMSPRSRNESVMVAKIVKAFKIAMHPGIGQENWLEKTADSADYREPTHDFDVPSYEPKNRALNTIDTSITLTYPDEFGIELRPNDLKPGTHGEGPLFKIHKCFLEKLDVDYGTDSTPAFFEENMMPVTTTLSLGFKETKIVTKEDIKAGY